MTRTKFILAGVMTTTLLLGAGLGAHAQNAGQAPGRSAMAAQRGVDPAAMKARMDERHAVRTQAIHDLLAITPAQEGAWSAYQAAMKPPVRPDRQRGPEAREERQGLTTPQRLDQMVAQANARHAELLARASATGRFYSQLSAAQKKSFDAMPQAGLERGGRGRGGPGGPGFGRGGPGMDGQMGPGPRGGRGGFGEGRGPRGERPAPAN